MSGRSKAGGTQRAHSHGHDVRRTPHLGAQPIAQHALAYGHAHAAILKAAQLAATRHVAAARSDDARGSVHDLLVRCSTGGGHGRLARLNTHAMPNLAPYHVGALLPWCARPTPSLTP
eukprot:349801-Chlamydomonas_euryale.AAC.46